MLIKITPFMPEKPRKSLSFKLTNSEGLFLTICCLSPVYSKIRALFYTVLTKLKKSEKKS